MSKKPEPVQKKKHLAEAQTDPWAADELLAVIKSRDPWGDWEWTLYFVGTAGIGLIAGVLTSFWLFSTTPSATPLWLKITIGALLSAPIGTLVLQMLFGIQEATSQQDLLYFWSYYTCGAAIVLGGGIGGIIGAVALSITGLPVLEPLLKTVWGCGLLGSLIGASTAIPTLILLRIFLLTRNFNGRGILDALVEVFFWDSFWIVLVGGSLGALGGALGLLGWQNL